MSAARLLKRITGRSKPSEAEAPALTHRHSPRNRPIPRSLEHWLLVIALCLTGLMSCWLIGAGSSLARASHRLSELEFRAPSLPLYLSSLPGKPPADATEAVPLTASEIAAVNTLSAIERAFDSIRQFENARAEFRLGKLKSVLSGVAPGSPAQQAGLQKGDELLTLWGKPAGFVWDVLALIAANGTPSAELEFKRGEVTYRTTIMLASGAPLDHRNMGLQFDIPEDVRYLGPGDARDMAEAFLRGYLEATPVEWRKMYAASLDGLMRSLTKRSEDQKARPAQDPAYLSSDRMLAWHHDAFEVELQRLRSQTAESSQAVAAATAVFGRAAAGFATCFLFVLVAFALHSRSRERHRSRRGL